MNYVGVKFGRLSAIEKINKNWKVKYRCICDCGNEVIIASSNLTSGNSRSCGCLASEQASERLIGHTYSLTHGHTRNYNKTKEYIAWTSMKDRCYNTNRHNYHRYGGRGIKVCERWLNSFEEFLEDVGKSPGDEYSIDRKDNDGNYEPGNVRWATVEEQSMSRTWNAKNKEKVYFVWVMWMGKPCAERRWGVFTDGTGKERGPVAYSRLLDELEINLSLDELAKRYPYERKEEQ